MVKIEEDLKYYTETPVQTYCYHHIPKEEIAEKVKWAAGVVKSIPAARRAITGNGVNVLAMGAFYVAPAMGCDIVDAYLSAELGSDQTWWHNFYEFHKLAIDELEAFDYESYKANGFKLEHLGDYPLKLEVKPE